MESLIFNKAKATDRYGLLRTATDNKTICCLSIDFNFLFLSTINYLRFYFIPNMLSIYCYLS
jgi:hypothetical protein